MAKNLENLIVPSVFAGYISAELQKANRVVASGAAVNSPQLSALLAGSTAEFNLPYWKSISANSLVPSTDPDTLASSQRLAAGNQKALRIARSLTPVAVADLEGMLIGEDPVREAVSQFVDAHNTIRQKTIIDMLNAVTAIDSADAGTDADLTFAAGAGTFGHDMLIAGTTAIFGDNARIAGTTLFLNSVEYASIQKDVFTAGGIVNKAAIDVGFGTYLGATLIVDDDVPTGTIYVVRPGGLAYGSASVPVPFEMERNASGGNGGGVTLLHSRDLYSYHVAGTSFTGAFTAGSELATDADIAATAKWSLVRPAKYCGAMKITHT